ncbi:exodeoxyribonuclease V subunit gamma [Crenothrix sp.]|uniref:exodeoxyribonuclease V subunit gamma n=1 Tax=Crenothrix sp. TaxID=3100433 RepID=UPI00374D5E7F
MFSLYSSHKTETLLANLVTVIKDQPLSSLFEKEVFLVQQPSMERWLSQQLASQLKVWGNYQFLVGDKFFNTMVQKINSRLNDAVFDRDALLWRIENLLRDDLHGSQFNAITQYLAGENTALKRYQLARKLAQIFDQYQILRPDMMAAWQQNQLLYDNETERWQKALWQRISVQLGEQDKGMLWRNVIAKLNDAEAGKFTPHLPERIFIFGIHHLAPVMLDFFQALSRHCPLHFFLFNPMSNVADQAHSLRHLQHPLLTSLGQQGYEFQEMLLERGLLNNELGNSTNTESTKNILQQLQNDILSPAYCAQKLAKDDSICIHACHSRMREVEVLKNQLLKCLEQDAALELRDIIVMSPDIKHYAPFISAVFGDIQHIVADSASLAHHAFNAFIDFLQLSQGRFGWKAVLDLLERPIIYPGFDLSDSDLDLIKHWLQDTRVRWGQSAEHKQELGVFACAENTWQATLDRLLMGYALGEDSEFVDGILPYKDIEGSSAQALGGLHDFLQLLFDASSQLKQSMALADWGAVLYGYADQLLMASEVSERQPLNDCLLELSALASVHHECVDVQVVIAWLQDRLNTLSQRDAGSGFLRGQLTFCSLQSIRGIPFKVMALLGMNEGDFPRIDQRPTFDLIAQHTRKGDNLQRSEDRYQFLDIILSARQQLIITYVGQSIKHNNRIAPAIVVSELLEVLRDSYQLADLVVDHPLHAFSARYFKGEGDVYSFSEADCATALALSQPRADRAVWWQGALITPEENVIELTDVFRFFQHPQRFFVQRQLAVRLNGIESEPEESEDFVLDTLDKYGSLNQGIKQGLQGKLLSVTKLQAQGRWLSGVMGELEAQRQGDIIDKFVGRINALQLGEKVDDVPVDINVGDYRLVGTLGNGYENGSLFYRYAALKGKDFMGAVLHHLIINRLQPQTTILLSADDDIVLLPEYCQDSYLEVLIDLYQQGLQRPDVFFVEAALAYVQQASKFSANADEQALEKAKAQLAKAINQPHELALKRLYGAVTDLDALLGAAFEQSCRVVLLPLWQVTHQNDS